jgi:ATP-dependent helicase/nuclease subunit B
VEHILDYLEIERQRAPFEVVALEQERLPVIAGETVRLVVDRIDRLPSGEQVILDYKSGKVFPGRWFSDRPEDPQLPLYAITTDPPPAAIAFAVIRDGQCEFRGISAREGLLPGLPPQRGAHKETLIEAGENLSATMDQWRHSLHALMADFLAGKATVDPKHGRRTCSDHHCQLRSLCRIDELDPAHAVLQEDAE